MGNKRFYWLQLPINFRQRTEIKRLYKKYPESADMIAMTYLDILSHVANTDGVFTVGEGADSLTEELALETDRNEEDVDATCEYLQTVGCMVILEEDRKALFPYLREIVGSETDSAGRMRAKRERDRESSQSDGDSSQSDTEKEIEKEIESETEIEGDEESETEHTKETERNVGAYAPTSARSAQDTRAREEPPVEDEVGSREDGAPDEEPHDSQAMMFCTITRNRTDIPDKLRKALKDWFVSKEELEQPYKLGPMKGTIDSAVKCAGIYGEDCIVRIIENCMANGYNRLNFEEWADKV